MKPGWVAVLAFLFGVALGYPNGYVQGIDRTVVYEFEDISDTGVGMVDDWGIGRE